LAQHETLRAAHLISALELRRVEELADWIGRLRD